MTREEVATTVRFDELIVSLGEDEVRLRFHPQLTVVGPVSAEERHELVDTVLAGATAAHPEVSLTVVDAQGEALLATGGTTYRKDGSIAPPLLDSWAADAAKLRQTVLVTAPDLSLPSGPTDATDQAELAAARAALDHLQAQAPAPPIEPAVARELADLDQRLRDADEAGDRAAYQRAAARLADLDRELTVIEDLAAVEDEDRALLAAADELDLLAQVRASSTHIAERSRIAVRAATTILERPTHSGAALLEVEEHGTDPLTEDFVTAARTWQRAVTRIRALDAAIATHTTFDMDADLDRRVPLLAPLDQDQLWAAHAHVRETEQRFQELTAARDATPTIDPAVEADLDAAHIERVRTEEVATARFRPGILGASLLAVTGLVTVVLDPVVGIALFAAAAGLVATLIVAPRRAVTRALAAEAEQLARVGATSYLGLHLRRLADPTNDDDQRELAKVARERTLAIVAWKELVGHLEPSDADGLEDDIRSHAVRFNATLRAERTTSLNDELAAVTQQRAEAQDQLRAAAVTLQAQVDEAVAAIDQADTRRARLLEQLGLDTGPDQSDAIARRRLAATQRARVRAQSRPLEAVQRERSETAADVARLERPEWDGPAPVPPSPAAVSLLKRRREELQSRVDVGGAVDAERASQVETMTRRVETLEARLGHDGSGSRETVAKRLLARLARARTAGGESGESLPVLLDDPFASLPVDRRTDLLDMLLRVSERMQVIYLTDDPVVMGWARQHRTHETLYLLEPVSESA